MFTNVPGWLIVLAQRSSNSDTFLQQLSGLIALVCALTVLWLGLMYAIIRRSNERRKAIKEGRPVPPPLYLSAYQTVRGWIDPQFAASQSAKSQSARSQSAAPQSAKSKPAAPSVRGFAPTSLDAPMPDLDLLTGDLPQPDLDALFGGLDDVPSPVRAISTGAPNSELRQALFSALEEESASTPNAMPPFEEFAMPTDQDAPTDAIELLRVYRDLSDGSLIVQIGGRHFRALSDLRGTDLERRFLNVLRDLNQMARASFSSATRNAQTAPAPTSPPAPAAPPVMPATLAAPAADDLAAEDAMPSQAQLDDLSMSPGTMLRQMTRVAMGHKPDPIEHTPILSVAEQIEHVLQERLKGMPAFRGRSIHVWQAPGGGVRIEVDGTFFEGVGEVADPEVRTLILDVVREWENRR